MTLTHVEGTSGKPSVHGSWTQSNRTESARECVHSADRHCGFDDTGDGASDESVAAAESEF